MPEMDTLLAQAIDHVASRLPGGEIALLQIAHGRYYTLDGVGARLWDMLETPHTARQLGERLVGEYDVDAARAAHDVEAFLASLLAADLLKPA